MARKKHTSFDNFGTINHVSAKTPNQKNYISNILNKEIVFCTGPSGCGKTFIAAGMAAEMLHKGHVRQIVVTRPLVCSGKDVGSLPGELIEKINPYTIPVQESIKFFLGESWYKFYSEDGKIRFEPLELMRGCTFHESIMILDEAQNCTLDQIKMFVTRMGEGTTVVVNGDIKQTDLRNKSGLDLCISKVEHLEEIAVCRLDYNDIQRNGIISKFLMAIEDE